MKKLKYYVELIFYNIWLWLYLDILFILLLFKDFLNSRQLFFLCLIILISILCFNIGVVKSYRKRTGKLKNLLQAILKKIEQKEQT